VQVRKVLGLLIIGAITGCHSLSTPRSSSINETVHIILVGDSTMATRTGYGEALCRHFRGDVKCTNLAKGGRSSSSFRAEGLWDNALQLLKLRQVHEQTYVLIQFGHNDQPGKPGRSTDLATEFPVNIARYVDEVSTLGGLPVLVTPLSRRIFRNNVLRNDLEPWAEAIRSIAMAKAVPLIDLNALSARAIIDMGSVEADTLAEEPPNQSQPSRFDYTHLGPKGAPFFANMVVQDLRRAIPKLSAYTIPR
jgi:lysophospholipase L1-like esterase